MANSRELNTTTLLTDPSIISYYRFEGNFNDSSGNGFNGTGSTSPTSVPSGGKFGGGYDWNGTTDNINATLTGETPFNGAWTFNAWIEPDTLGEGVADDYARIFDMGGKTNFRLSSESGSNMKMRFTQAYSGPDGGWTTDDFVIPKNTYTMVSVVFNGTTAGTHPVIYVNGVVTAITNYAAPTGTIETSTNYNLGNNVNSGVRAYDGAMDDVSLFSRALTATEILNLYHISSGSFFLMF